MSTSGRVLQEQGTGAELRRAFGCFPSGVTAVCAINDGQPVGIAASSFTSVSLDPPLVSVCIDRRSKTLPLLLESTRVGVSILADAQDSIARSLAGPGDRFDSVPWRRGEAGAVFIDDSAAGLECSVYDELNAGDHQILLLRVHGFYIECQSEPLIFHGSKFRLLAAS